MSWFLGTTKLILFCNSYFIALSFLSEFHSEENASQKKTNKKGSVTINHCYAATQKKSQNPPKNLTKKATKIHTEKLTRYKLF